MKFILAGLFVVAGVMHFVKPAFFKAIVPDYFPTSWHYPLVYWSGVFEILGGIGLLLLATQQIAAWGLIALLIAVFPANLYMAYHARFQHIPSWIRWGRLPLQLPLMYWVYQYTI